MVAPTNLIGLIRMEMTVPGMKDPETAMSGDKVLEPMMLAVCVEEDPMTGQHPAPIHLHLLLQHVPTHLIGLIRLEMTVPGMKISETVRSLEKFSKPMRLAVCVEEDHINAGRTNG